MSPVPSPCVGLCRVDPRTGHCTGCYRSLEEICAWLSLDDAGRRAIRARCTERRARARSLEAGTADEGERR